MQIHEKIRHKQKAFEQDAIPHMGALYNFALRMSGNADDAHDLVQETYLKAFRFFDSFEQGTNCKAWLFRIMKNTYINIYHKTAKEPEHVDFDEIQDSLPSQGAMQGSASGTGDEQEKALALQLDNELQDFYSTVKDGADANVNLGEMLFGCVLDDEIMNALQAMPVEFRTVVVLCDIENFSYEEIAAFIEKPIGTVRSRLHRGRKILQIKLFEFARANGYATAADAPHLK